MFKYSLESGLLVIRGQAGGSAAAGTGLAQLAPGFEFGAPRATVWGMGRFATVTAVVCAVLLAGILPAKVAQARNKGQTGPALEKSKGAAPSAASHKLSGPVKWGLIAGTGFFVGSMALGAAASTAVVAAAVGAAGVGAVGGSWEMRRMKPIPKKDPATDAATAQQPAGTWQSLKAGFGKATGWIGNKKDKAVQATQDFESKLGDYAAGLQNSPPERGTVPAT